ncbi:hypothetical protein [Aquimarina mytili]|nr:hypothetical protein [Aquimarina mytili]
MQFSLKRIINSVYRDVTVLRGSIVTGLSIAAGILFIAFLLNLGFGDHSITAEDYAGTSGLLYVLFGVLFTFSIFKEVHDQKKNHLYLTLPISPVERVIAVWITTYILYTVAFTILGVLIGQMAIIFGSLFSKVNLHFISIFSEEYWKMITFYLFVQPVFFYGAIRFGKNRMGKTVLSLLLVFLGILFYNFLIYGMLNHDFDVFSGEQLASEAFNLAKKDFSITGRWLFMIILGPAMFLAGYFRMIEKEV